MSEFLMIFAILATHAIVFWVGFKIGAHIDGSPSPEGK